jgi:hypothetical protein
MSAKYVCPLDGPMITGATQCRLFATGIEQLRAGARRIYFAQQRDKQYLMSG